MSDETGGAATVAQVIRDQMRAVLGLTADKIDGLAAGTHVVVPVGGMRADVVAYDDGLCPAVVTVPFNDGEQARAFVRALAKHGAPHD